VFACRKYDWVRAKNVQHIAGLRVLRLSACSGAGDVYIDEYARILLPPIS